MKNTSIPNTALFTTIYPGVVKYMPAWIQSLKDQTDKQVDIWIGIDHVNVEYLKEELCEYPGIHLVDACEGESPIRLRERSIDEIVRFYNAVIFVDSDDILLPDRIAAAKNALISNQVYGCSMEIIDEKGKDSGISFCFSEEFDLDGLIYRGNIYGLSNTAYRTEILRSFLPVPPNCILLDWYFAISAWAINAKFIFDPIPHMKYRQYASNIAKVLPPFSKEDLLIASKLVISHYEIVLENITTLRGEKRKKIEKRLSETNDFFATILRHDDILSNYLAAINHRPIADYWWAIVANHELEEIWNK